MDTPLVTVICLCYNHERFVKEAIESVIRQTHRNMQLIVVDDASLDESVNRIRTILMEYPEVTFLPLKKNLGNCRAFNKGFELARGKFIIDLAADDALMPSRIEQGIAVFESLTANYGVNFSDAELIDEQGRHLGFHSERFPHATIPQGDIYKELIGRYFISSPTLMMRREVLETLGGYDESLAYEDFDFWIRSARKFNYCYSPEPLVRRRIIDHSMARTQYQKNSPQLVSTFKVCEKIAQLNQTREEDNVLKKRIRYEMRRLLQVGAFGLVFRYLNLMMKI